MRGVFAGRCLAPVDLSDISPSNGWLLLRREKIASRMQRLLRTHLPVAEVLHAFPDQRFRVRIKASAV